MGTATKTSKECPVSKTCKNNLENEKRNATEGLLKKVYVNTSGFNLDPYIDMHKNNPQKPETVHENLWEHAKLNINYGLFRVNNISCENMKPSPDGRYKAVLGDVFQIRGNDLANMTIVFDGVGWVVMDVLTTTETAKAVWTQIVEKYLQENAKITTVIYSHSHVDHYGGVGGLSEFFADDCKIYAPQGFTEHAVSENIYVGAAMARRAIYQYGSALPHGDPKGHVDCGLSTLLPTGENSIIKPTVLISDSDYASGKNYCEIKINDNPEFKLQFQYTPGTEAPAEMNVYLPAQKILFMAENCSGTLHNLLTPRGAQVRDPLAWANFLDQTLTAFTDVETLCAAHHWPRFGANECIRFIENQRDMYRFINNATLHLINRGYTINEVGRIIESEVPEAFINDWCCHGFYGTYNHNAKAVYQRYMGWYDGNPTHLNQHMPSDRANRYIDAFGAEAVCSAANNAMENDPAWAAELYDYILNADASKVTGVINEAKNNYANALKKLGYASEAATWRNMYLTGAQEVNPTQKPQKQDPPYIAFTDDTINAMSLEMILQYLGIMLDFKKIAKNKTPNTVFNIVTHTDTDKSEYAVAIVQKGILSYRILASANSTPANFTVEASKVDFFRLFAEHDFTNADKIITNSTDAEKFIREYFMRFPINFPIMTPRPTWK